jgi:2-hydroxy-3-keto-5-methylthiopentenyl-1-phosphate phosphatase
LITIQKEKEIGLKWFCPDNFKVFNDYCIQFAKRIKLNNIFHTEFFRLNSEGNNKVIIASASFKYYLEPLFPKKVIIGTEVSTNNQNKITGINQHPFGDKKKIILMDKGFDTIDVFYTDSLKDLPTTKISKKTIWVYSGNIIEKGTFSP